MRVPALMRRLLGVKEAPFTPVTAVSGDGYLPLSRLSYASLVRGGLDSNVIMAPVQWIMRALIEAEPIVERQLGDKPWTRVSYHALEKRLRAPNEGYDGDCLFQASAVSWELDGNVYWLKRYNAFGEPVEFWYIPHWLIEPMWPQDGSVYISHYQYTPEFGRPAIALLPRDVVHLRFGLDPRNTRKGLSPLKALMREVYTDEQAAAFAADLLKNMGVPGLVISPKGDFPVPQADVNEVRDYIDRVHTGEGKGRTLVLGGATDVHQFGFDPNQLNLTMLRDVAEERVCAAVGLPAAVVGFGAGLQATKVGATMREMRRLAWVQCIIPLQLSWGRQLSRQLLPEFEGLAHRWRVRFDTSNVSAFQEERTEQATRIATLVGAGVMRVDQGQEEAGLEIDPSQAIYLRPSTAKPVEEGDAGIEEAQPVPVPGTPPLIPTPAKPEGEDVMARAGKILDRLKGNLPARNGDRILITGNPYRVAHRGERFCVEKISTGETMKCYPIEADAMAYFRALEAATAHE